MKERKKPLRYTTIRVAGTRLQALEFVAQAASQKCNKQVRMSNIIQFLIDHYCSLEMASLIADKYTENDKVFKLKRSKNENEPMRLESQ